METDALVAQQALRARIARATGSPARLAFLGVFFATLLGFLGIGAVLPVLPRYVRGPVGAGDFAVGVVTGAFALSAILARPLAGRAADLRGRRVIVAAGAALMAVAAGLYFVPAGVPGLIAARLVLGAGEGCVFTAGATWAIDLAPDARRGQAIGLFGLAIWGGLAIGPPIGELLFALGGYQAVWAFAAAGAAAGALLATRLPDAHVPPPADADRGPLLPAAARRPGAALALANAGYAALAGFVVLHLQRSGAGHGAAVFTAFAVAVVTMRLLGGRLPDRVGASRCAIAAGCAEAAGLGLIALATTWPVAVAGALAMGAGFSLLFPALALLVVNRVDERQRGAALGAFTAFFDTGVSLGAPLAGAIASVAGYPAAFWTAAGLALLAAAVGGSAGRARHAVALS